MSDNNRIMEHPILGDLKEQCKFSFIFNGSKLEAYEGDTIASALLANNIRQIRYHEESGNPRGIYCNIGHCFECRVNINGQSARACVTPVYPEMNVTSLNHLPTPLQKGRDYKW